MPLLKSLMDKNNMKIGIWKISEEAIDLSKQIILSDIESAEFTKIKNSKKQEEWLSARVLLAKLENKTLRTTLVKDEFGKPSFISGNEHISISHSASLSAALISNDNCGIDIQCLSEKLLRIAPRVLNSREIFSIPENENLLYTGLFWSAKEALYKAYGKRKLNFKTEILVEEFQNKDGNYLSQGRIKTSDYESIYELKGFYLENYTVVYAILKTKK